MVKHWIVDQSTAREPSIYQLGSDFVKQLFRIQIQKGGKVLLRNQVKFRMEACYSELVLVYDVVHQWFGKNEFFHPQNYSIKTPSFGYKNNHHGLFRD